MHTPNIFSPLLRRVTLLAAIEAADGELTPELDEALTISDDDISARTKEMLELRSQAEVQVMGAEADIARAQAFIKSTKRTVALIDTRLLEATKRVGPITAGTYKVGTRASSVAVVQDEAQLPAIYLRHIPAKAESYVPDLVAIAKALRAGEQVDGAVLENRVNLAIK